MTVYGADPDQLRKLAVQLKSGADSVEHLASSLSQTIATVAWKGPDAETARDAWTGKGLTAVRDMMARLRTAGDDLVRNADEQTRTSSVDGAGGGGAGGGGAGGGGPSGSSPGGGEPGAPGAPGGGEPGGGEPGGREPGEPGEPGEEPEDEGPLATEKLLADVLGVPATAVASYLQGKTGAELLEIRNVLASGDMGEIMTLLGPDATIAINAAAAADPGGMAGLRAQLMAEEKLGNDALKEAANAAAPLDAVGADASVLAKGADVLGKIAAPVAGLADIYTLSGLDPEAGTSDKVVAGANLGGLALAATGTELGASALGLVGIDAIAAPIPVVGEVVVGATALYIAGDFVYAHREAIEHGIETGYHAVTFAVSTSIDAIGDAGSATVNAIGDAGSSVVHGIEHLVPHVSPPWDW